MGCQVADNSLFFGIGEQGHSSTLKFRQFHYCLHAQNSNPLDYSVKVANILISE